MFLKLNFLGWRFRLRRGGTQVSALVHGMANICYERTSPFQYKIECNRSLGGPTHGSAPTS